MEGGDDQVPELLRLVPSQGVHKLPVKQVARQLNQAQQANPVLEFAIEVKFSKALPESTVVAAYQALHGEHQEPGAYTGSVRIDAVDKQGRQWPLGVEDDDECHDASCSHSHGASHGKAGKSAKGGKAAKKAERKVHEVCVWLDIVSPAVTGRNTPDSDDESDGSDDGSWEDATGADESTQDEDTSEHEHAVSFEPEIVTQAELNWLIATVGRYTEKVDPKAKFALSEEPASAAERAERLAQLVNDIDSPLCIHLRAPPHPHGGRGGYRGADVWDTLLSLGMQYCPESYDFALADPESGIHLFSAKPRLPERYVRWNPESLVDEIVFSCFMPMAPSGTVFKLMSPAATYVQQRLGGQLCNEEGAPLKTRELKEDVESIESRLKSVGLTPGSDPCMQLWS